MVRIFKLHKITVIVPTTAELHRKEGLLNAIESIISQEAVKSSICYNYQILKTNLQVSVNIIHPNILSAKLKFCQLF